MTKSDSAQGVLAIAACLLATVTGSCTSHDKTSPERHDMAAPAAAERSALRPVTLPDLSQMATSAQTQVHERYASLMQRAESTSASPGELANSYGELGKVLMAADHRDAAEPCYVNAETLAPNDFRWPYYLGHLYRQNGELAKAIGSLERALRLKPDDVPTLVWLGNLYLDGGQPLQARPQFEKALSLQPAALSARFGLGRTALAEQDYAQAVRHLEAVLSQDPQASGAHYPLAMAYRGLGDLQKAEAQLRLRKDQQILPADPLMADLEAVLESPQTYESRGIQALDRKDWAGAAALFRRGLELAPDHAALRHRLGTALYMMGDIGGAQALFEEVVRASPDHFLAQYSLGVLLQSSGRHVEAIEHFSAALRARDNYTDARLRLANSLRHTGRASESLHHYQRVLAESPDNTEARFNDAMALVQLRRYRDARKNLTDAISLHPDQSLFAHGLARLLAAAPDDGVRDGERAMALVEDLLKREQRTLELGETMAMALAALGRYDEAASVQRDLMRGAENNGLRQIVPRLAKNLALYERREPCRTPWAEGELP